MAGYAMGYAMGSGGMRNMLDRVRAMVWIAPTLDAMAQAPKAHASHLGKPTGDNGHGVTVAPTSNQ